MGTKNKSTMSKSAIKLQCINIIQTQVSLLQKSIQPFGITFLDAYKPKNAHTVLVMLEKKILENVDMRWEKFVLHPDFQVEHVYHFEKKYNNKPIAELQEHLSSSEEVIFFKANGIIYRTNPFGEPILIFNAS